MAILEEPKGWASSRSRLLSKMHAAVNASPPGYVNLSIPKHTITTPCLWDLVYEPALSGKALEVRWSDGSRSGFPCGFLPPGYPTGPMPQPRLRLGLMSFRHPELDYIVDLYACRNCELASLQSIAAEEAYAYQRACEVLCDAALAGGALVEVYHTGLEPMVVGFYRGAASVLAARLKRRMPRNLWLAPMFYIGEPVKRHLGPTSPGTDPGQYIRSKVWM